MILAVHHLAEAPARVRSHLLTQGPGVQWVDGVEALDVLALERIADRLEERLAVLLEQRLEERQPQNLALAFVDARSEEVVNVVAEKVPLEERPAAMGFHEELNGRFLHRLAAENLGDDAL